MSNGGAGWHERACVIDYGVHGLCVLRPGATSQSGSESAAHPAFAHAITGVLRHPCRCAVALAVGGWYAVWQLGLVESHIAQGIPVRHHLTAAV